MSFCSYPVNDPTDEFGPRVERCPAFGALVNPSLPFVTVRTAPADDPLRPAFVLLLLYGLRRGEVMALRWSDIDSDTIHVRQQVQRINGQLHITARLSNMTAYVSARHGLGRA